MKTLTIEGELDTLDGIAFHRAEHANMVYVRVFSDLTVELSERIKSSGFNPLRPIRATLTVEQDEG